VFGVIRAATCSGSRLSAVKADIGEHWSRALVQNAPAVAANVIGDVMAPVSRLQSNSESGSVQGCRSRTE
jgi:hypothetical protein